MRTSRILIVLGFTAAILLTAAAGSRLHLKGIVEYSLEDRLRFVRTKEFIYQIDATSLEKETRTSLDRIGSTISIDLPVGAVTRAWPTAPSPAFPQMEQAAVEPDSISESGPDFLLVGTILPSASREDDFLQVRNTIFQINIGDLSTEVRQKFESGSGRATIRVPKTALRSSWSAIPTFRNESRTPASISRSEPRADHFSLSKESVDVMGTILPSFDQNALLIQSGEMFIEIRRSAMGHKAGKDSFVPGDRIELRAPISAVSLVWSQR